MAMPPKVAQSTVRTMVRWLREPYEFMDECREKYGEAFTIRLPNGGLPPTRSSPSPTS